MSEENPFRDFIARIRAGDQAAASELIARYEPTLRRVARLRLYDPRLRRAFDSTDVSQSVFASFFARAARGQYRLDSPEQLLKLLWMMCRKKVVDRARVERAACRDYRRTRRAGPRLAGLVADGASPSRELSDRELVEEVRKRLPDEDRALAEDRAQGREWDEIAAARGASPEALRKKLARAVGRVARRLGLEEPCHG